MKKTRIYFVTFLSLFGTACSTVIEVDEPKNYMTTQSVFQDDASTSAALLNVYSRYETTIYTTTGIHLNTYMDDLFNPSVSGINLEFLEGRVSPTNGTNTNIWTRMYAAIYQCNEILEHLNADNHHHEIMKGEALFMRAYLYFHLVNIYGDIPLVLSTNVNENAKAARTPKADVYGQLVSDLESARKLLPTTYPAEGKARATKWAATTLLARIALYQENWEEAASYAGEVISSGSFSLLKRDKLEDVFSVNNSEAIFQMATPNGYLSSVASITPSSPTNVPQYQLTPDLIDQFESHDLRLKHWIGTVSRTTGANTTIHYYSHKYKSRSNNLVRQEYANIFRLAELYLIRAEARAKLGDLTGADEDLRMIRVRSDITKPLSEEAEGMLVAIKLERRRELFMEDNHRFYDLKRWGMLDKTIGKIKPLWATPSALLPIPESELRNNINLTQNPGY